MRSITTGLVTTIALLAPAVLSAGQIYGTIVAEGKGVKDVAVDIKCGSNEAVSAKTAADGAYRINVPQQGQCSLTLPTYTDKPSAMIFSTPNPALYNFTVVKDAEGKFALRRRQ